jgi:pimeloyl-ACP methyl ester carboxylesterase
MFATLACTGLRAQDIAGQWQGTLKTPGPELRMVLQIAKDGAGWKADLYSIDQTTDPLPASSISLNAGTLKFSVDRVRAGYEGKLSADSNAIAGTFTQGVSLPGALPQGGPLPLEFKRATPETAWVIDPGKHSIQFITVDKDAGNDVKLEVLDWGGSGAPMVFLTGLGNNAHVFDKFAPKFADRYHVYGITRRGFGRSSVPAGGYGADRLGDDVLAVIDALKLSQPVLVGHSIGGEELSSIGSRHPEKVAALVYLDAGYYYAFYDSANPNRITDVADVRQKLEQLMMQPPADPNTLIKQLLESDLPQLAKDLEAMRKEFAGMTAAQLAAQSAGSPMPAVSRAIILGGQKYNKIPVPILAIYAVPHDVGPLGGSDPAARAAAEARDEAFVGPFATAFEKGVPTAHVVRIPHANHYVFNSNEADVIREMNAFLGTLKRD